MSLPAQLQKQVDDARKLAEQLRGGTAPDADNADVAVLDAPAPAAAPAPAEPPDGDDSSLAPAPAAQAPAAPPATPSDEDENSATYAQRWRTLQGKHNALLRNFEQLQQRQGSLEQLIAQMQTTSSAPAPAPAPTPARFLTEKDEKEYGVDMTDYVKRAAREEVAPLAQAVHALVQRIEHLNGVVPVVNSVAQQQQATSRDLFMQRLSERVPNWQELNDDPDVHQWLLQVDPLTGISRQTYLQDAEKRLDLARVVSIFKAAEAALGKAKPAAAAPAPAPSASAQSKLERQVAPGRASAATPAPQQNQGKQWTRAEIATFFADRMRGKYKGREAEAQALEQDIFKAQRENRVTG